MIDYHIHTSLCNHAEGGMEAYIRKAVEIGLTDICFLDHLTMRPAETSHSMALSEVPFYFQALQRLKQKYKGKIKVKIGLEIDFNPIYVDIIKEMIERFSFDVIGGSLHYAGELNIVSRSSSWNQGSHDQDLIYDLYFEHLTKMLDYNYFDVVCHLDLIKKFGRKPLKSLDKDYNEILSTIKQKNLIVEINTDGYNHPAQDVYPSFDIIRKCREHGISITLGSDAHMPANVGQHYDKVLPLLIEAGYRHLAVFDKRKRSEIDFTEPE